MESLLLLYMDYPKFDVFFLMKNKCLILCMVRHTLRPSRKGFPELVKTGGHWIQLEIVSDWQEARDAFENL